MSAIKAVAHHDEEPEPTAAELLAGAFSATRAANVVSLCFDTRDQAEAFAQTFNREAGAREAERIDPPVFVAAIELAATVTPIASLDKPRYLIEGPTRDAVVRRANEFYAGWGFMYGPYVSTPRLRADGVWVAEASRERSCG